MSYFEIGKKTRGMNSFAPPQKLSEGKTMEPSALHLYLLEMEEQLNRVHTIITERINEGGFETPSEYRSFEGLIEGILTKIGNENITYFSELKIEVVMQYEPIQRRDIPTREVVKKLLKILALLDAQCRTTTKLIECRTEEMQLLLKSVKPWNKTELPSP